MMKVESKALTEEQAAQYINFSRSFLRQSRMDGDRENRTSGPKWIKCGKRAVRYLKDDLDAWLEQFRREGGL